jgi:hypothetical protein
MDASHHFNTIIFWLYQGSKFYWQRKSEYLEKTTVLTILMTKIDITLEQNNLYRVHYTMKGNQTDNVKGR